DFQPWSRTGGKPCSAKRAIASRRSRSSQPGPPPAPPRSNASKAARYVSFTVAASGIALGPSGSAARLDDADPVPDPVVALGFEREGQVLAARLDDATIEQHVHVV